MRIVFMGTPEFAVPSLRILHESGYNIVGVISATDKLLGRGKKKIVHSAVSQYALNNGLRLFQPKNLKHPDFVEELRSLKADLQVVVAFRMLPEVVWNMPPLGSINLHGSLLPSFRGAAPINWAIAKGVEVTGLTTFKLRHEIDTGSIIFRESVVVRPQETAGDLYERLMHLGAPLTLKTVRAIEKGELTFYPQDDSKVSHAPKVFHENCQLDLDQESEEVINFIHGMSPFPAAWIMWNDKKVKLMRVKPSEAHSSVEKGSFFLDKGKNACLQLNNSAIEIVEIQPEGKPRMSGKDFGNGYLRNQPA